MGWREALTSRNSGTCFNMDEPGGHHAKRNKPVARRQISEWIYSGEAFIKSSQFMATERRWINQALGEAVASFFKWRNFWSSVCNNINILY